MTVPPTPASGALRSSRPERTRRRTSGVVLVVAGVVLTIGAPVAWWQSRPSTSSGAPLVQAATLEPSPAASPSPASPSPASPSPASTSPASTFPASTSPVSRAARAAGAARVQPPRRLLLPRLRVSAPVDPVGVDRNGLMALPEDVNRVGWYRFGPAPGAATGSAVVAGHVDDQEQGLGVLARLRDVRLGDAVVVEQRDGAQVRYRVTGITRLRKQALPTATVFARTGPPRLTLVTCAGPFDRERRSYRDNLVVTAEPVP